MSMMETGTTRDRSFLRANPVLSRLSKVTERTDTNAATYRGIASKTSFFLLLTLIGIMLQMLVRTAMVNEPAWQSFEFFKGFTMSITMKEAMILLVVVIGGFAAELTGIFVRRTVPVTGSIYAVAQGYVISFMVFTALKGYEYLGLEALIVTMAVIGIMSWLYTSGKVQANGKFQVVLFCLILGSIAFGVFTLVGSLIPATRPLVLSMTHNVGLMIVVDLVGILIASMFLISDFTTIDNCVREGYPKEYEWSAAFGLIFTVLWLYVKVLDLIVRIAGKVKES